jgi:hypothetical protein
VACARVPQQLGQLGNIGRDPPRLVVANASIFTLKTKIHSTATIAHDKASRPFLDGLHQAAAQRRSFRSRQNARFAVATLH